LLTSVGALTSGCAGEASDGSEGTDDPSAVADEAAARARFHYTPSVSAIKWHPGCGVQTAGGNPACAMGWFLTYTRKYIDLKPTIHTHVDNGTNTITVRIDTWSFTRIHPLVAVRPETIALDIRGDRIGTTYKLVAEDSKGHVLWTGKATPFPAA
jgi:hypothetical protein